MRGKRGVALAIAGACMMGAAAASAEANTFVARSGSYLFIGGDGQNQDIKIEPTTVNGEARILISEIGPLDAGSGCVDLGREVHCSRTGLAYVEARLWDGWDRIEMNDVVPLRAYLGYGEDYAEGGPAADTLIGEAENDVLYGESGDDMLFGQGGNDVQFGGSGADYVSGQDGDDRLYGNAGRDHLYGYSGNDLLDAYGASDPDAVVDCGVGTGDRYRADWNDPKPVACESGYFSY